MVQVFEKVQSPLEQLNPYIQNAAQSIGQGFKERATNKRTSSLLSQLENPELSQLQQASLAAQLPGEVGTNYLTSRKLQAQTQAAQEKAQALQQAKQQEVLQREQKDQGLRQSFDRLDELIPYTGGTGLLGIGSQSFLGGFPGTEAFEKRKEFDTLGFWATDNVYTHFNPGVVSDIKFKSIREDFAPRSDLTERENRARISAMRLILSLPSDISKEKFDSVTNRLEKELNPSESNKKSDQAERPPLSSFNITQ